MTGNRYVVFLSRQTGFLLIAAHIRPSDVINTLKSAVARLIIRPLPHVVQLGQTSAPLTVRIPDLFGFPKSFTWGMKKERVGGPAHAVGYIA
jgi:hypothetical protein